MKTLLLTLAIIPVLPMVLLIIDGLFIKHPFFCNAIGWHPSKFVKTGSFDGCSVHGKCTRCGKSVMQDSNGDWF